MPEKKKKLVKEIALLDAKASENGHTTEECVCRRRIKGKLQDTVFKEEILETEIENSMVETRRQ